jgi:hypothetical protein
LIRSPEQDCCSYVRVGGLGDIGYRADFTAPARQLGFKADPGATSIRPSCTASSHSRGGGRWQAYAGGWVQQDEHLRIGVAYLIVRAHPPSILLRTFTREQHGTGTVVVERIGASVPLTRCGGCARYNGSCTLHAIGAVLRREYASRSYHRIHHHDRKTPQSMNLTGTTGLNLENPESRFPDKRTSASILYSQWGMPSAPRPIMTK